MEVSEKKMSCREAVRIMLSRWEVGASKTGGRIEREVRQILFEADSDECPSGKTISRRFQEQKPFDIVSSMEGAHSKYERFKSEKTAEKAQIQVVRQ